MENSLNFSTMCTHIHCSSLGAHKKHHFTSFLCHFRPWESKKLPLCPEYFFRLHKKRKWKHNICMEQQPASWDCCQDYRGRRLVFSLDHWIRGKYSKYTNRLVKGEELWELVYKKTQMKKKSSPLLSALKAIDVREYLDTFEGKYPFLDSVRINMEGFYAFY